MPMTGSLWSLRRAQGPVLIVYLIWMNLVGLWWGLALCPKSKSGQSTQDCGAKGCHGLDFSSDLMAWGATLRQFSRPGHGLADTVAAINSVEVIPLA